MILTVSPDNCVCDFYKHKLCSYSEIVGIPQESVVSEIFHIGFTNPSLSTARLLGILAFLVASANDFLLTWIMDQVDS